ncbi:S41 family peptidase [Bdellovibrio svalbardensis]|uniref:S41 family peptidase n=1 Tax=Bdellovibrio svalbardensis TaxID=2972972 RepID=A0ABT6DPG1_9BACT|nr:S41 family peptidase [Bdellovibrio svalbardensis]MDG0817804.1 S41 family peptidase [Bdellovibrio svalbardensis]
MIANSMVKIVLATFLALACAVGAFFFAMQKSFVNPYPLVCNFVAEKIYLSDDQLADWKKTCLRRSRLVTAYSPKKLIIQDLNNVFDLLKVSHLEIYDAKEVQNIWQGESTDTGLEGDFVESELVIFKVHPQSPAEKAGLKKGDIVVSLNGEQPSSWTVASEPGQYRILRGKENLSFEIKQGSFQRDDSLRVQKFSSKVSVLKVPSFRADFFTEEKMKALSLDLRDSKMVVLDLRGNAGGNFVAGLRLLSEFICEPVEVGQLVKPRYAQDSKADLPNDLKDENQLAVLDVNKKVSLRTFKSEGCFTGKVRVLIDGKSSSVSEMVAQALKEFKKSYIAGAPSRGQLLVGVWYPMDEIAPGVQISIPEAYYQSARGQRIEGQGVSVDRVLYYKLPQMQAGIDSWVDEMLRN